MPSFERMRELLPSLYRPDDDDPGGQLVPLNARDVVAINGQPLPDTARVDQAGMYDISYSSPLQVRQVRLAPHRAPGSGYTLALYRFVGDNLETLPRAFATVRSGVGSIGLDFTAARFGIQLRRGSLLTLYLSALGEVMEDINRQATYVLQSHWFDYADAALFSPFFLRSRLLEDPGNFPPKLDDPELDQFPYIHDLARLGALLSLSPWQEPAAQRELVEAYRERIRRIVALYRHGLGTVDALRGITEAELPVSAGPPAERHDRPFDVEEFAPLVGTSVAVRQPGPPADMVGPLMRWTLTNNGIGAAAPTIYVQGVTPEADTIDATTNPVVELYTAGGSFSRLGIAYSGTLAPNQTLRLRPAYSSWIGLDSGLQRSISAPTDNAPANPTAPGPWQAEAGAPAASVRAMQQSADGSLWAATVTAGTAALWRFDGQNWSQALSGLPAVNCLAVDNHDLLIGTAKGLLRLPLHPEGGAPLTPSPAPNTLNDPEVHALFRAADGQWWVGNANGAALLSANVLQPSNLQGTPVHTIRPDRMGTLFFGTDLGVFQYQPGVDRWYWYAGGEHTEQTPDWQQFLPKEAGTARHFPAETQVFLPGVLSVYRGPDASLWLGTAHGLARYIARAVEGLAYETRLEAFPDLGDVPVTAIEEDARGHIWFCSGRGLFRHDGRDLWQFQAGVWTQLGRADQLYDTPKPRARGVWRFVRSSSQWQQFQQKSWTNFSGAVRTTEQPAVRTIYWSEQAIGDLGQWDGSRFTHVADVPPKDLRARYKPSETRILNGGVPRVPPLPVGDSVWRYLTLEPEAPVVPASLPAWTIEGRLLPPPPDLAAAGPGRFDITAPPPATDFDQSVYAYHPSARIWFAWEGPQLLTVLVRLKKQADNEHIDPVIIDRVWQGIQQVRPAGVRSVLAVEEEIVKGRNP